MIDVKAIKKDFPVFRHKIKEKDLVYLDNAATTHKPQSVLEAIQSYYSLYNANPHRGAHYLSYKATELYEQGREIVKNFIHAKSEQEIVFTKNTTESINLVAMGFLRHILQPDDQVVCSISDHHSCLLPLRKVAEEKCCGIDYFELDHDYSITDDEINNKITKKTKAVFIGHISNVIGTVNPIKKIIKRAHEMGAYVLVDGAQSAPHMPIDVQDLDADFFCFSSHKMLGPMGIGILYGKSHLLDKMEPVYFGGSMIDMVDDSQLTYKPYPYKFEAGTQNVEGVVGTIAAIEYLQDIGMENIWKHGQALTHYLIHELSSLPYMTVYSTKDPYNRSSVVSFNMENAHPHDVASIVDLQGVAIRAGLHCARPLMQFLSINSTCRASSYIYNDERDMDQFIESLKEARRCLYRGH